MEFLQLKYFCEAAEMQNISRAAQLNKVPASGVSSSIKRLEQELGVELFLRYANRIKLTEQGKIFYDEALHILEALDNAKTSIKYFQSVSGKITICAMACIPLIEKAIIEFKKQYPDVGFELYRSVENSGNVDFYISDELFYVRGCLKQTILDEKMMLVVRDDHPLASRENLSVNDLKKEKFLCTNMNSSIHHRISSICYDNGFIPNFATTLSDAEKISKYIYEGFGIGILPESEVQEYNGLVMKNIGDYRRKVCVFYEEASLKGKANELFLEKLIEVGALFQGQQSET